VEGRAHATNTCIPISGICGIKLVATSDPLYSGKLHDSIIHRERVVSGNSKDFGYSNRLKACKNVLMTIADIFDPPVR
jgi:hypothetical protein